MKIGSYEWMVAWGNYCAQVDRATDFWLLYIQEKEPHKKAFFLASYEDECEKSKRLINELYEQLS